MGKCGRETVGGCGGSMGAHPGGLHMLYMKLWGMSDRENEYKDSENNVRGNWMGGGGWVGGTGNSRLWKIPTRKIHLNNSKSTLIFVNFRLG